MNDTHQSLQLVPLSQAYQGQGTFLSWSKEDWSAAARRWFISLGGGWSGRVVRWRKKQANL